MTPEQFVVLPSDEGAESGYYVKFGSYCVYAVSKDGKGLADRVAADMNTHLSAILAAERRRVAEECRKAAMDAGHLPPEHWHKKAVAQAIADVGEE